MAQHVVVQNYDPAWPEQYQEEKANIEAVLGDNCLMIWHIGSTSVPGLAAKPVIDMMAAVRNLEQADEAAGEFEKLGYEYLGEFGIAGRRYLRKGGDERTHQLHIFHADDLKNISRHLAFRDYMRSHEKERGEYARLKKELAGRFPYDIEGYCGGKEDFVHKIEELAVDWYDGDWNMLYLAARKAQGGRVLSPFIEAGGVSAALMTESGRVFVGVCIDTASSLGMCAERNAMANMITNGESQIVKLAAVMPDGGVGMPCGACREFMMQLGRDSGEIEILADLEARRTVRLKELVPDWWGTGRFV